MKRTVTREEFNEACEAVWEEIQYQNDLPRRTDDEAKDPPGFFTLGRVLIRRGEDAWYGNAGNGPALPTLRSLAAVFVRAMVYCGIQFRT